MHETTIDTAPAPRENLLTACVTPGATRPAPEARLRVLTLNVAHGRRDSLNQLLLGKSAFRTNLQAIGRLLERSDADVVALQELDGPSRWSGGFDHAETLAGEADYGWRVRASHARSWLFDYGTALLSRLPVVAAQAHRFAPTPPTLRKGFVLSQVAWRDPADPATERLVDVVSVHMDFLSRRARASQVGELAGLLDGRDNPAIVMGDFNSDWSVSDSPVRQLAERLGLQAYRPDAGHLATHDERRIDWILLSPQLSFHEYRVLPDVVSDHRAVIAEIGFRDGAEPVHARVVAADAGVMPVFGHGCGELPVALAAQGGA
jgi:endonuclease/exonuclease/phosphatase family metal-dependent hydrolase